jgi:sortase A
VNPGDLWVLDPSPDADLTLITCFPFEYVGRAPKRFIVQARKIEPSL